MTFVFVPVLFYICICILISNNIPSSFGSFIEPDLSLSLPRCCQPIVLPVPVPVNALTGQELTEVLKEKYIEFLIRFIITIYKFYYTYSTTGIRKTTINE